jgi:hypothetical protein
MTKVDGPQRRLQREASCEYPRKMKDDRNETLRPAAGRPRAALPLVVAALVLAAALGLLLSVSGADPSAEPMPAVAPLHVADRGSTTTTKPPDPPQEASRLQTTFRQNLHLAGTAREDVAVYDAADEPEPRALLPALGSFETPNAFLVAGEALGADGSLWLRVFLPDKPNESQGWVRAEQLDTFTLASSILIDVSERRLDLYRRGRLVESFPVAVGKAATPTPRGRFFVTVQLEPPNPGGAYGPVALGLSAYSEVLTWWEGGGQAAIHGTNQPGSVGNAASNGCVRMRNEDVRFLAGQVPVGTPVVIVD